jgi:hypothetical protein
MKIHCFFVELFYTALLIQVFLHTKCFSVFVIKFAVQEKGIIFHKRYGHLHVFNIRIHHEKMAREIMIVSYEALHVFNLCMIIQFYQIGC